MDCKVAWNTEGETIRQRGLMRGKQTEAGKMSNRRMQCLRMMRETVVNRSARLKRRTTHFGDVTSQADCLSLVCVSEQNQ